MSDDPPTLSDWPTGLGEMAERIRSLDWKRTPLGPKGTWPESLKNAVDLILPSGFPMIILWGDDLIQLYNDEYRDLMGNKHPSGLGRPTRDSWPEVWNINEPIYERVWTGETLTFEDALYPITRSGQLKDAWFTLSYSPLRTFDRIGGVLVTLFETTEVHEAAVTLRKSEERYRAFVISSSDIVYRMGPDWTEMRQLDGRGFVADTRAPTADWMDSYILPEDRPTVRNAIAQAIQTKSMFELEHRVLRPDFTLGWVLSRAVPILDEREQIIEWLGTAKDVSDRKQADAALRASEDRQAFLLMLSDRLRVVSDPQEVQGVACRLLGEHIGSGRVYYLENDTENGRGIVLNDYAAGGLASLAGEHAHEAFSIIYRHLDRGRTWVVDDAADEASLDEAEREHFLSRSVRAWIDVPLIKRGQLKAALCVVQSEVRDWSSLDIALVEDVADRTWAAVERARAEVALHRSERHANILLAQLQHRVRNTLAIIRSIARRTADRSENQSDFISHFEGRLSAFSRVQAVVTRSPDSGVSLKTLVEDELLPLAAGDGAHVRVSGPEICLSPRAAESMSLAIHELATNAIKYGALSVKGGRVLVDWKCEDGEGSNTLMFEWRERGLDERPVPSREGFGHELLLRSLPYDLSATTNIAFEDDGLRFTMSLPFGTDVIAASGA